jgi:hypothetical protein
MTHISSNYASKLAIAGELARLDARAVTITSVAGTKSADSRAKYKQVHGFQSRSGQTPTDHQWFLASQRRRQHAAFLLLTYVRYRGSLEPSPDAHGLSFVLAYRLYLETLQGERLVCPERFNLLVRKGYQFGWREITKGGHSKFPSDNVMVTICKKCRVHHLAESHYLNYVCPSCRDE